MKTSQKAARNYEIDMCNGPLLSKIILFAIPLMMSGILQLLFNAADIIVVGRYAGSDSLAAVGATSSLINLLINVFIGLSIGTNVLVARFFASHNDRDLEETVQTSVVVSLAGGVILIGVGFLFSGPLLTLMGTPDNVLPLSTLYMQIYFAGMPATLLYNFGSAILRAVGDTRRPLYYLLTAGIINVFLNLFFVIQFSMGVAGVALATVISQCVSAGLILLCLVRTDAPYRVRIKRLRIVREKFTSIVRIGLPAGLQGAIFSISNVLIQSSVNSFGSIAMAGNTASSNIEGFVYTSMNAVYQTALSFTSQNYGSKNYRRMTRVLVYCEGLVILVGLVLDYVALRMGSRLLHIYSSDSEVIRYGLIRMKYFISAYFTCGMMDVMVGALRGMGCSVLPMIVSLTGACAFRVVWIYTVFAANRTLPTLYLSYPVSWILTFTAHLVCYVLIRRRMQISESGRAAQNTLWRRTPLRGEKVSRRRPA